MADQQEASNLSPDLSLPLEGIMSELEKIVSDLEDGSSSLDDSLRLFERGVRLARLGQDRIDGAEKRIEQLLNGNTSNESKVPF